MKAIKEFLKPNWWKVGLLLFWGSPVFWAVVLIIDSPSETLQIFTKELGIQTSGFGIKHLLFALFCGLLGLYLFNCLIYFIITKIKRLIAKPK
jgi:hypothetical protein